MPIYEYACPNCRKIFNFLSRRINPQTTPACPECGSKEMIKQVSRFSAPRGAKEPAGGDEGQDEENDPSMPDFDDPKVRRAMNEIERDMGAVDENNPRHMAHVMKKMKEIMPRDSMPKELDTAIKRLEKGEDPEKIEEDMGDVLSGLMGEGDDEEGMGGGGYSYDEGLYDL